MFTHLIGLGLLLGAGGEPKAYPRADLLIEPSVLAGKTKFYNILDVRPKTRYDEGHIVGAVRVDPDEWARAFAASQDRAQWAARIGKLGITQSSPIVIYDDTRAKDAARVWWILRYFGAQDVRLLNGGWPAWKAAGNSVGTEAPVPTPRDFAIGAPSDGAPSDGRLATKERILKVLKADQKPQLIDARSEAEHCGTTKLAKRGGAIPGSVHLEWSDALDPKTQKFKSPAELTRLFKDAGIDLNRPAITYCQSGGRAAVMAFTLELMGARDVANYYRSWSEWGNAEDTPVEQKK
jgi:thiosulfate/3-mercaptopyruvate sulfurtransferase